MLMREWSILSRINSEKQQYEAEYGTSLVDLSDIRFEHGHFARLVFVFVSDMKACTCTVAYEDATHPVANAAHAHVHDAWSCLVFHQFSMNTVCGILHLAHDSNTGPT